MSRNSNQKYDMKRKKRGYKPRRKVEKAKPEEHPAVNPGLFSSKLWLNLRDIKTGDAKAKPKSFQSRKV